jgi:hypothetical protein
MNIGTPARATLVLVGAFLLGSGRTFAAERQIRPFVGVTFAGATTFVDLENTVGAPNLAIGGSAALIGEVFGVEADVADVPGLFGSGDSNLVRSSRVTTISGNVIIAAPHRLTEYALRPYLVAGAGFMRVRTTTAFNALDVATVMPAFDVGGGAIGFITDRIGLCWDLRRFQDARRSSDEKGLSFAPEHLSFWRAAMAIVIRY